MRTDLDPSLIEAFCETLLGMKDSRVLAPLSPQGPVLTGFQRPRAADYEFWSRALANEAAAYDLAVGDSSP